MSLVKKCLHVAIDSAPQSAFIPLLRADGAETLFLTFQDEPLESECVSGQSILSLMKESTNIRGQTDMKLTKYAFSQYPRPSTRPQSDSDQPRLPNFMGYSVRSAHFRYTRWVKYDRVNFRPRFEEAAEAEELYDHLTDSLEDENLAQNGSYARTKSFLTRILREQFS